MALTSRKVKTVPSFLWHINKKRSTIMELTKRRLKEIIAEEMQHLADTGDINMITEAEKKAFAIILEKLTPKQLEEMGLKRV